eukprot:gene5434-6778_t
MVATTQDYGEKSYWDTRYIKDQESLMLLGCGNSQLGEDMNDDSYSNIINIDYSEICIDFMKEKTKHRKGIEYLTMDGRDLQFGNDYFDGIFDKGTLDAVMCTDEDNSNAKQICLEVSRVLKPGSFFVVLTYGSPESRLPILKDKKYNWSVTTRVVGMNKDVGINHCHYLYIMKKNSMELDGADQPEDPILNEKFENFLNSSIGKIPLEVLTVN